MVENGEFDVIVVGGGVGGCATAVEAAKHGLRVLVVEVTEQIGGNAVRSTGYLAMADTAMQREAGITDSPEIFLADIEAEINRQQQKFPVQFNREIAETFVRESGATYDQLYGMGVRWSRFVKRPTLHTVDRMVATVDTNAFRTGFEQLLDEHGVTVITRSRAVELLRHDGMVDGVRVRNLENDAETEYHARRAVVLSTGSYNANGALRERYQLKEFAWTPYLGLDTVRGDGHIMAAALGADLVTMAMIPLFVVVPGALLEDCIAVNRHGERYHDENGPYDDRVQAVFEQPDQFAHYIFDQAAADAKQKYIREFPEDVISADTLEELAEKIGCPPETLVRTVERWNEACRTGVDPDFNRLVFSPDRRELAQAPYYASRLVVGITFPSGGIRVTEKMQAIDVLGRTIPGLYAVGDCAGGLSSAIGLGGLRITPSVTLGRITGREVATTPRESSPVTVADDLMNGPAVVREDHGTTIMLHD